MILGGVSGSYASGRLTGFAFDFSTDAAETGQLEWRVVVTRIAGGFAVNSVDGHAPIPYQALAILVLWIFTARAKFLNVIYISELAICYLLSKPRFCLAMRFDGSLGYSPRVK